MSPLAVKVPPPRPAFRDVSECHIYVNIWLHSLSEILAVASAGQADWITGDLKDSMADLYDLCGDGFRILSASQATAKGFERWLDESGFTDLAAAITQQAVAEKMADMMGDDHGKD